MKKLLIRTLSGIVYVMLVIFAIYATKWFHNPTLGCAIFTTFFFIIAMIGLNEYFRNLSIKGVAANRTLGMILGALTYIVICLIGPLHLPKETVFLLPALWSVIWLTQLWHSDPHPFSSIAYTILPIIWIVLPFALMQYIGNIDLGLIMMIFICTWVNDSGAYLTGMSVGIHHLWERHSPNKTWEGTIGGVVFAILCAIFVGPVFADQFAWWHWLFIGLVCGVFGTLGDLVESMFKRYCGVKDSGNIMPGHGGILDRFDSLLMIIPFIAALIALGNFF